MFTWLLVAVLTSFWLIYKFMRRHMEKCAEQIPGDVGHPIIGNALAYSSRNTDDMMRTMIGYGRKYREYGINKSWIGCVLVVGVNHPKYIEVIANSPHAVRKGPLMECLIQGLPKGVFATDDISKWKVLRKPLTKILSKRNIQNEYHGVFLKKSKKFAKYIKEKKSGIEMNLKKEFENFTVDTFSENILGVETNEMDESKFTFVHHVNQFLEEAFGVSAFVRMFKIFDFVQPFTRTKTMVKEELETRKLLQWVLRERMEKNQWRNGEVSYYSDFLLKRKMERNMTMLDIERELVDVLYAGTDTTAVALSSALLFLAMFPDIQEEAYQEQLSIFGEDCERDPTPEDITSMVYLTRVVKETIRFCSPPLILKYATGDINLDNYTIPKGSVIVISIDVVCFDDRYWEQPHTFHPDHFLPDQEADRPTFAYPVFGIGPRICPGIQYAVTSMKIILSSLLRNFRLTTSTKFEDLKFQYNLMREFNTYSVKLEERNNRNA